MSGYRSTNSNNQKSFNFKTTSGRMQLEHRAGVLQYPSPKRSKHNAESFQGCTDVIVDISRSVKRKDKLNTASSAKEIETPPPDRSDNQSYTEYSYSQKDGDYYSEYTQNNYSEYTQKYYSEDQYSASVHSYDDDKEGYETYSSLHEEEEEEYLSENEKIGKEDEVNLSSYDETSKSNQIDRDLDEGQTSSVQLRSLDNEDEDENEKRQANKERSQKLYSDKGSSAKEKNQKFDSEKGSSAKERNQKLDSEKGSSARDRSQKLDSEKGSSSKGINNSKKPKETRKPSTDSNKSDSQPKSKQTDSINDEDLILSEPKSINDEDLILSEPEEEGNGIANSNSENKSEASQYSSSRPSKRKTAQRKAVSTNESAKEEDANNITNRFNLIIEANQKLVAALFENQKAICNACQDQCSEEALKHIQAAYDILMNINNNH